MTKTVPMSTDLFTPGSISVKETL